MSGCVILDSSIAARKNGKRLPCEVLQAENAKLRERENNLFNAVIAKSNELLSLLCEVEKLRELVRDWYELAVGGADSLTDWNHAQAELEHRMRELGVKAD